VEDVKIRRMAKEDIDAVMEIERDCFTVPWSRNAFLMEIEENKFARYVVAEKDGWIVGYGGMWLVIDEAHITNIAVRSAYRRQGFGRKILSEMIRVAEEEGILRMTLEVRRSNDAAQRLYQEFGFRFCGVRPGYYQDDHEDALIMWRENSL